jgi:hypothetical protein
VQVPRHLFLHLLRMPVLTVSTPPPISDEEMTPIDQAYAALLAGVNAPPAPDLDAVILSDAPSLAAALVERGTPACGWCGSSTRAQRGYVPGFRGGPVDCSADWHDGPGEQPATAAEGEQFK